MAQPSLRYNKQNENVADPTFATRGSACFDMFSYFQNEHISLWLDDPDAKQLVDQVKNAAKMLGMPPDEVGPSFYDKLKENVHKMIEELPE